MADDALTVLVYSDDRNTRELIRLALGRRPAADLPPVQCVDVTTEWAVRKHLNDESVQLVILDGEAVPYGGLGVCRGIKEEIFKAPPVMVVLGRAVDGWLASWSGADAVITHPIDPMVTASKAAELLRSRLSRDVAPAS